MRAFEVSLNGSKLCVAGISADGVLTAIVTWVAGDRGADLFLEVGGLVSSVQENVTWIRQKPLVVGDEIRVNVREVEAVDPPSRRKSRDPEKDLEAKKKYVRVMAKELGWAVQEAKEPKSAKRNAK
jgi:hypothetical protein